MHVRPRTAAGGSARVTFARASTSPRSVIDHHPATVLDAARGGQHGIDLGVELGLQLGQPRQVAAHRPGRVVLGEPEGGARCGYCRSPIGVDRVLGALPADRRRVRADLRIQRVGTGDSIGS